MSTEMKLKLTLKDPRAIEIVENIPPKQRDEIIEKYIILGEMVVSHASIATRKETVEEFFSPLRTDINTIREQLRQTFPKGYTAKAMVFDVLFLEDYDLEPVAYRDRREILQDLVPEKLKHVDVVETVTKGKKAYFRSLRAKGGEGVILKERQSPYTEGSRSSDWLKVKHWKSDEAVVVGYTHGENARASTFGALILAQRDKKGRWRYVGKSNVASPADQEKYAEILRKMHVKKSPLVDVDMDEVDNVQAWVKPEIVIEVKYYEKTADKPKEQKVGKMRFPAFLRERHDKDPEECVVSKT